jgi:hypothetical protein
MATKTAVGEFDFGDGWEKWLRLPGLRRARDRGHSPEPMGERDRSRRCGGGVPPRAVT